MKQRRHRAKRAAPALSRMPASARVGTLTALAALLLALPTLPADGLSEEQALAAVERFITAWNSRSPERFAATLHYPHVRPTATGGERVFATPAEYAAGIDFERVMATGWRESRYDRLAVIHLGKDKAHVAGSYTRYREDGSAIWTNQVTYVVTVRDGSTGIQARFAAGFDNLSPGEREANAASAEAVVRRYLEAFNARDEEAWVATFHYPHLRLAGDSVRVWQTPQEYMDGFDFDTFAARYNWQHTEWTALQAVQVAADGVNVALTAIRYDPEGEALHSFHTFYLVTRQDDRWGIRARSSFAP